MSPVGRSVTIVHSKVHKDLSNTKFPFNQPIAPQNIFTYGIFSPLASCKGGGRIISSNLCFVENKNAPDDTISFLIVLTYYAPLKVPGVRGLQQGHVISEG